MVTEVNDYYVQWSKLMMKSSDIIASLEGFLPCHCHRNSSISKAGKVRRYHLDGR